MTKGFNANGVDLRLSERMYLSFVLEDYIRIFYFIHGIIQ